LPNPKPFSGEMAIDTASPSIFLPASTIAL